MFVDGGVYASFDIVAWKQPWKQKKKEKERWFRVRVVAAS